MEKKCKKCNVVKDISEFGKDNRSKFGTENRCYLCKNANSKQYYEANKEKIKEQQKQYYEANKRKPNLQEIKTEQEKKRLFEEGKKQCNKCNIVKDVSEFSIEKRNRDGLRGECNVCRTFYYKQKYGKQYREANKEKNKVKKKAYYEVNKDKKKAYDEANKDKIREYRKQYNKANRGNLQKNEKEKLKTDSFFKLKKYTRSSIKRYLKDGKSKRTREIIGIDYKEFQDYLEVEYTDGMHLDHIVPLSWANNDEEVYTLNHYSNFQIITAEENLAKKDTYCKSENLKKVLDNHNDLAKLNKIIERNSDKIK